MPSIGKRDRKKRRRQCTEYYRSALSQASFFFAPQIAGPDGPAALGGSNRAHPGGLPKKSYFTGPGFLEGLFKLDKLQRDHRAGSEMYSKSRCLSKLPEAFKPAVTSLQSWHFSTFLNIPFSGQVPAYGWLFRTFALLFFSGLTQRYARGQTMLTGRLQSLPSASHSALRARRVYSLFISHQ